MKIIQKIGIVAVMVFFMGGIIYNSFFVSNKQDESYASLKEKYNINTTTKVDTEEPVITEAKEPEQKADIKKDNVASESKQENRTRENIIWDYLKSAGYNQRRYWSCSMVFWKKAKTYRLCFIKRC